VAPNTGNPQQNSLHSVWNAGDDHAYQAWRSQKLKQAENRHMVGFVAVSDISNPGATERAELIQRCRDTNMALYQSDSGNRDQDSLREGLRRFAQAMGLEIAENHRSADPDGIVALTVTDAPAQKGYIPYSRRAMNWHTDGYYNPPEHRIRAMVLHCVTPAQDGGQNQFLDPEIAYIRLRDQDPSYIRALMHPDAMTIPENVESDGSVRPESTGPVFWVDSDQKLAMRYTARTRSISWRDDPDTQAATTALQNLLEANDPLMQTLRLEAGQGILCNNVLHNRTGFDPDARHSSDRLVFRIRFHNRVKGS